MPRGIDHIYEPDSVKWNRPRVAMVGPAAWQTRVSAAVMARTLKPLLFALTMLGHVCNRRNPETLQRKSFAFADKPSMLTRPIKNTRVEKVQLRHCGAEWVCAPEAVGPDIATILYLHGGAFITCGLGSHRRMLSHLSRAACARVLSVDYRMLPVSRIPHAVADGLDAYRMLLTSGASANSIVIAGDSAGGYLAAMTALSIREAGLPVPAGQVLLSGLTDCDMGTKLPPIRPFPDAMFPSATLKFINDVFVTKNGTEPTLECPVHCDLSGLGPFLQQVGSREALRYDAVKLANRLDEDGVSNWLQVWDRAPHVFQVGADFNPDARHALTDIGEFVRYAVATATDASTQAEVG